MTVLTQRAIKRSPTVRLANRLQMDLASITLALVIFAFPMSALLSALLSSSTGFSDGTFSIAARVVTFLAALLLFVKRSLFRQLRWPNRALVIFSVIYIIRLVYDAFFADNPAAGSALVFFFVSTLVPTIALACIRPEDWNERGAILFSLAVGTVFVFLANWMLATGLGQEWIDQNIVMLNGGRQSFERMNPILLGHKAVTVVLICASIIVNSSSRKLKLGMACIAIPSLYTVYLAASRGPILALIAGLALLTITNKRGFQIAFVLLSCVVCVTTFLNIDIQGLLEQLRFTSAGTDSNSVARIDFIYEAIDAFWRSPIIGENFEMPITGGWPHNVFAEVLMATGLIGMAAFLCVFFPVVKQTWKVTRLRTNYAGILFVQIFIGAQFSGSLWGTADLWVAMALVLAVQSNGADNTPLPRKNLNVSSRRDFRMSTRPNT
jgi:O-antigen ligase